LTIRLDGTAGRQAILPRSYAVGLMVAAGEAAALAERLLADTVAKQGVEAGALTIHADRGTSITSKPVALLLADLGVTKTITSGGKRKPAKADRVAGAGRGGGFSWQQSCCSDAVAADATVPYQRRAGRLLIM
jgi:hypothetical protein